MGKERIINLLVGPVLFLLCAFLLPEGIFGTFAARAAVGTIAWMAYWWITAPVDYAVTAFLPIALNAIVQMTDMSAIISNYASETIMLLLGASIITVSWEETGLDKRIAARFLGLIGDNLRSQIIFWFVLSALLSSVLPNAVVCATMTPIAVAMLNYIGEGDIGNSRIGSKLLLTIAYAAGLGGIATPLGGAMNLVTVDYIQQITGEEYIYMHWVVRFLPIFIVLMILNILFMLRDVKKDESLGGSREFFVKEYKAMPPMKFEEKWSLALFIIATVLAFTRQAYQDLLPGLKPAYAFIICGIIAFLMVDSEGKRVMLWKSAQKKIIWELIYIFAGGLVTVLVIITVTLIMSDVTSNTATAAVAIPIVISIVQGIGLNPIPYIYIASIGVNLSYMLPTSIRAVPVGYGLKPRYMLNEGWKMSILVIIAMTALSYLLLRYWPAFSLA